MVSGGIRVRLETMAISVSEHTNAADHPITNLLRVREALIATVLQARAACETGADGPGLQLLLSAAVKDVEDLDQRLYFLDSTAPTPQSEPESEPKEGQESGQRLVAPPDNLSPG